MGLLFPPAGTQLDPLKTPREIGRALADAWAARSLSRSWQKREFAALEPPNTWFTPKERLRIPRHVQLQIERAADERLEELRSKMDRFYIRLLARLRGVRYTRAAAALALVVAALLALVVCLSR